MKKRIEELLKKVTEYSKHPNNSYHQYQINRDFGFLNGLLVMYDLVEPYNINESEVERLLGEIESDYKQNKWNLYERTLCTNVRNNSLIKQEEEMNRTYSITEVECNYQIMFMVLIHGENESNSPLYFKTKKQAEKYVYAKN